MKRWILTACGMFLALSLTACGLYAAETPSGSSVIALESPMADMFVVSTAAPTAAVESMPKTEDIDTVPAQEPEQLLESAETDETWQEDDSMINIKITVGDQSFAARLYENETARALSALLPMTLDMNELHGNEKYYNLDEVLPVNASCPAEIHTGDLMLYGSDCLVLFYESVETSYSYTPLGYVEEPVGLSEVLGAGGVQVVFELP